MMAGFRFNAFRSATRVFQQSFPSPQEGKSAHPRSQRYEKTPNSKNMFIRGGRDEHGKSSRSPPKRLIVFDGCGIAPHGFPIGHRPGPMTEKTPPGTGIHKSVPCGQAAFLVRLCSADCHRLRGHRFIPAPIRPRPRETAGCILPFSRDA